MAFPKTPHELSRIAARFMLVFIMAPFILSLLQFLLFGFGLGLFSVPGASASEWAGTFGLGWAYTIMISPVFVAFAYTLLAWIIASVGVLVASRGPALASAIFAFAAFVAARGLQGDYWFVTAISVGVLVWLALAGWSLRKYVHKVQVDPRSAEDVLQQHHALRRRDISTQEIISRR